MAENAKPKLVCRYLRVSTSDQNPSLQADETAEFIQRRGWQLADTFLDKGVSGSRDRRPELDRMLAGARRGLYSAIVVWKADRLFRSLKHMVVTLDELAALGVDFVSVTEPFDTTTPQGRLLLHLVSAFGEFERGILRERVVAGQAAARRRGVKFGRPRVPVDVSKALALRAAGKSLQETALVLGVGKATLHRALKAADAGGPIVGGAEGVMAPAEPLDLPVAA